MKIEDVVAAEFVKRPNRFQGYVKLNGEEIKVAVPNTGRCKEILVEGTKVILRKGKNPKRITPYDLIAAYKGEKLINIDSQAPNKVVYEALLNKNIDRRNFRKKMLSLNIIEDTNKTKIFEGKRPAKLYKFKNNITDKNVF